MIWILLTLQGGTSGRSLPHMATGGKRYLLRPVLRRRSISAPALCPPSCDDLAAPSKISKAGALFTGLISRWACHWLTVTIRAEWERIWMDDQGAAIARDRFLDGMFEFSAPACNRGCRILHARGRTFVCRLCAGYDYSSRHKDRWAPALDRLVSLRRRIELGHPLHGWSKRRLRNAMLAY